MIDNNIVLSHVDGSTFVLPKSILVAAQKENHFNCKYLHRYIANIGT